MPWPNARRRRTARPSPKTYPFLSLPTLLVCRTFSTLACLTTRPPEVRALVALNTALFFHTYLRGGDGIRSIGTLAWLDGWTLERKLDP
jgi:hypothetical protein